MHRVTDLRKRERMGAAVALLPQPLRFIGEWCDLFTEDPCFAGHDDRKPFLTTDALEAAGKGRPDASGWPHVRCLLEDRTLLEATIVVPPAAPFEMEVHGYIHELGHVIDHYLGDRFLVPCVTEWASETNPSEAFAEWVCAWLCDHYRIVREAAEGDERSRALWHALSTGAWDSLANFE